MTAPFKVKTRAADSTSGDDDSANSVAGNIKVAVRFRPLSEDPKTGKDYKRKNGEKRAWTTANVGSMVSLTQNSYGRKVEGRSLFHFDQVFEEDSQTPLVYKSIARPMVHAALNGKHATIFAYGQTGSGKTYTMQGEGKIGSGQAGIIQLVTTDLFRFMRKGDAIHRAFKVKVSYFEIYNEKIRDLLPSDSDTSSTDTNSQSTKRSDKIQIRTNANGEIVVNVRQKTVKNVDEALKLLIEGNECRAVAATDMNSHSSRSHAVFRLTIESRAVNGQSSAGNRQHETVRVSDFNLVDLAGSESLKTTNATGRRKREGATINKSLLALTTVIQSLSKKGKKRPQHINYRDSKLTRILQPHLSGNADMAILCCASPSMAFLEETRTTLKFAARAKLVEVKPQVNEVMDDRELIRNLQAELAQVRKQLEEMKQKEAERVLEESNSKRDSTFRSLESLEVTDLSEREDKTQLSLSASGFQLDAADPAVARKTVLRYQRGRVNSIDPDDFFDSSQGSTAELSFDMNSHSGRGSNRLLTPKSIKKRMTTVDSFDTLALTEDETSDDMSMNVRSYISSPCSILHLDGSPKSASMFGGAEGFAPNGRLEDSLSWDAMEGNGRRKLPTELPLTALDTIRKKEQALPEEVTIIDTKSTVESGMSFMQRLKEAGSRIKFLEDKLEVSEDAREVGARDLERARRCIHDLVERNAQMNVKLKEKEREVLKEIYQNGEIMVEQYWLLRASLYISVFFFLSGSHEYFLATVFFVWLVMDTNVTV